MVGEEVVALAAVVLGSLLHELALEALGVHHHVGFLQVVGVDAQVDHQLDGHQDHAGVDDLVVALALDQVENLRHDLVDVAGKHVLFPLEQRQRVHVKHVAAPVQALLLHPVPVHVVKHVVQVASANGVALPRAHVKLQKQLARLRPQVLDEAGQVPLQPRVHLRPGERVRGLVGAGPRVHHAGVARLVGAVVVHRRVAVHVHLRGHALVALRPQDELEPGLDEFPCGVQVAGDGEWGRHEKLGDGRYLCGVHTSAKMGGDLGGD